MTVEELIEILSEMDQNAEIRLATQPSWPLAFGVVGAVPDAQLGRESAIEKGVLDCEHFVHVEDCDYCERYLTETETDDDPVVWIVEGSSCAHPYAPRNAWELARGY